MPRNVNNVNNLASRRKGLQRFWLHPCDHYHAVTQTYNNCAEIHLDGVVMSPFVSPLSTIARAHDPAVQLSGKTHEDSVHILVIAVVHWCLRAETHPCGNVMSAVIMPCLRFWSPWLARTWSNEQRGHHVTCINWNEPKLAAYNYTSSLALWTTLVYELVDANRGIQKVRVEPATRSAVATWLIN